MVWVRGKYLAFIMIWNRGLYVAIQTVWNRGPSAAIIMARKRITYLAIKIVFEGVHNQAF
jgi:hypothetical protein